MPAATTGLVKTPLSAEVQATPCFALPLLDRAADLEESALLKVIEPEYTAKYLEYLGANPSQAAQDLVRKSLPLTVDCLQTKLKASGHRHNEVIVVPPSLQYDALPIHEADPQEVVRLGFIGTLAPDIKASEESQTAEGEYKVVSRSFTQIAAAFLDKASRASSGRKSPDRHGRQRSIMPSSPDGRQHVEPKAGRVGVYCHLNHMQRELARPFRVLPATVRRNQLHFGQSVSEWYSALPRAAKSGHGQLKEQDVQSTSDELVSDKIIDLAVHAVTYLYHEFVVSSPAFPQDQLPTIILSQQKPIGRQKSLASQKSVVNSQASVMSSMDWDRVSPLQHLHSITDPSGPSAADLAAATALQMEGQRARLFSIVQLWAQRSKAYHQTKWATSFVRPVVVLSLRALVEKMFTDALPIWSSSTQGAARLKSMDAQLLEWLDPHGFNSSISMLQSLPAATQRSQGCRQMQQPHWHRRQHFTGTTSLVGTFLTQPKTAQCRRLKHQATGMPELDDFRLIAALDQRQKGVLLRSAEHLLLQNA